MKLNKRGINQFEYIAGMLIFIFGLVVVMYFVLTFNIAQRQDYLTTIENNLKREAEMSYETYYLSVNDVAAGCFTVNLPESTSSNNLTILSGNSKRGFENIDANKINVDGGNGNYKFIFSDENQYLTSGLHDCQPTNAKFSIKEKKYALNYSKIIYFSRTRYLPENYNEFKTEIANGKDFTIGFEILGDCPGIAEIPGMTRYVPQNAQVTAGKFPTKLFVQPNLICDVNVLIKIW